MLFFKAENAYRLAIIQFFGRQITGASVRSETDVCESVVPDEVQQQQKQKRSNSEQQLLTSLTHPSHPRSLIGLLKDYAGSSSNFELAVAHFDWWRMVWFSLLVGGGRIYNRTSF